ncbi:MAG: nucleotidyltransferase domain-containing protein [Actinobacteria bacterium]|nr:nucleotidyltransferase domain-containing protein [Actinomycetota bacterium]MBL7123664.1 nucleotidyltransferase domain-containing protein [Actinomycetota bacterium]
MNKHELKKLNKIFRQYPSLKLVYLFGSQVSGKTGPLSDYDFAFYIDDEEIKAYYIALEIEGKISTLLATEKVDSVILNYTDAPELKYSIIKSGKVIYEIEPYKLLIEPKILNEYFDFRFLLRKYQLTKT